MELCRNCDIEYKIEECCGAFPETGKTRILTLNDGSSFEACLFLNAKGACRIYDLLPESGPCKRSQCPRSYELDLVDLRQMRERELRAMR